MITISKRGCSNISEVEITKFERENKLRLPRDYRAFLLSFNGGIPKPSCFDIDIDGFKNTSCIRYFLRLSDSSDYSLQNYMSKYKTRLPHNLLPIATELSASLVCMSILGQDYGKVYFWDHNWEVTESTPDYSNIHFLAENFTALLDMLYE
jgi:hypothetical protein